MSQQQAQQQGQQQGDASLRALQFAIQTTLNSKKLQQENEQLKLKLKENEQLLSDFDDAAPRAKSLKAQLKEKEQKLEQKRKELIQIQEAIISTLKSQAQPRQENPVDSLRPIPLVMNNIQELIMNLTENAVDQRTTAIPVLELFGVSDKLNRLYDALVDQEIISETPEERDQRNQEYVMNQQQILDQLKDMLSAVEEEDANQDEEEDQEPEQEQPQEEKQKVVEVTNEEEEAKEEAKPEEAKPEEAPAQPAAQPAEEKPAEEAAPANANE